jgi:hypothetical protein
MSMREVWSQVDEQEAGSSGEVCGVQVPLLGEWRGSAVGGEEGRVSRARADRRSAIFCNAGTFLRPGYVYAIKSGPLYKIGQSKDYVSRLSEIWKAYGRVEPRLPYRLEYAHVFACWLEHMNRIERHLHELFAAHRLHGEWFALPDGRWFDVPALPIPFPTASLSQHEPEPNGLA